jgi:hypothetical protein
VLLTEDRRARPSLAGACPMLLMSEGPSVKGLEDCFSRSCNIFCFWAYASPSKLVGTKPVPWALGSVPFVASFARPLLSNAVGGGFLALVDIFLACMACVSVLANGGLCADASGSLVNESRSKSGLKEPSIASVGTRPCVCTCIGNRSVDTLGSVGGLFLTFAHDMFEVPTPPHV